MASSEEILVNLNARVPRDLWRRTKMHATKKGVLLREFITEALVEALRREKKR
jgi:predicted HicB family RNase H-like nuclease